MKAVLSARELTKTFSGRDKKAFRAVDGVSFDLYPGECLGLIGESGSGKTTLVNMLTHFVRPTEGRIFLDGEDITDAKGTALRRVYGKMQMVFQTPAESFDPRRTLGDGVGEGLRNQGKPWTEARKEAVRLLELCGLNAEFAARYPHQVSGGECQRAAIARAIAVKPKVLLCDEATSALDVTIQAEVMALLRQLRRELGLSCLFICHDVALVRSFCERVLVMYHGRIVEEGTTDEVIRHPKNDYTKRLIQSVI